MMEGAIPRQHDSYLTPPQQKGGGEGLSQDHRARPFNASRSTAAILSSIINEDGMDVDEEVGEACMGYMGSSPPPVEDAAAPPFVLGSGRISQERLRAPRDFEPVPASPALIAGWQAVAHVERHVHRAIEAARQPPILPLVASRREGGGEGSEVGDDPHRPVTPPWARAFQEAAQRRWKQFQRVSTQRDADRQASRWNQLQMQQRTAQIAMRFAGGGAPILPTPSPTRQAPVLATMPVTPAARQAPPLPSATPSFPAAQTAPVVLQSARIPRMPSVEAHKAQQERIERVEKRKVATAAYTDILRGVAP